MTSEVSDAQRQTDALALLEALQQVTTPVVINVAEIAASRSARVNTVQVQYGKIKKRYNLNLSCTTICVSKSVSSTPTPKAKKVTKPRSPASGNGNGRKITGTAKVAKTDKKKLDALEDAMSGFEDETMAQDELAQQGADERGASPTT